MHPKALIDEAAHLLGQVLRFEQPADTLVSAFFRANRSLGSKERHALAETTYAALRQRLLIQHLAQSGHGPMERRLVLLAWAGEPRALEAATTVDEKAWLKSCAAIDRATLAPKLRHNLPDWVAGGLQAQLDEAEFTALTEALLLPAAAGPAREYPEKAKRDAVLAELLEQGVKAEATAFSPWGIRLQGKPSINQWPQFKDGVIEVQDEGSQLLALLLDAKRGEMVADFCAGAGGKTLALGAMMRNTGRLYAFDIAGHRLENLRPRLARLGLVERLSDPDRARARRACQAALREAGSGAGRRTLLRPGHPATQPRSEMAAKPGGGEGACGTAAVHPEQRGPLAQAWRPPGLCHLQPAAG